MSNDSYIKHLMFTHTAVTGHYIRCEAGTHSLIFVICNSCFKRLNKFKSYPVRALFNELSYKNQTNAQYINVSLHLKF
jgi:hypothetical protein